MNTRYDIYFLGLKRDTIEAREEFIQHLASTHRKEIDHFEFLLDADNMVLYSNLELTTANKTAAWLEKRGAYIQIKEHTDKQKKIKKAFRRCPECDSYNRVEMSYCVQCRYDFRKN